MLKQCLAELSVIAVRRRSWKMQIIYFINCSEMQTCRWKEWFFTIWIFEFLLAVSEKAEFKPSLFGISSNSPESSRYQNQYPSNLI